MTLKISVGLRMEISVKNKFFHTQDLRLRTNLRYANSARMEINMHKFLRAVGSGY